MPATNYACELHVLVRLRSQLPFLGRQRGVSALEILAAPLVLG